MPGAHAFHGQTVLSGSDACEVHQVASPRGLAHAPRLPLDLHDTCIAQQMEVDFETLTDLEGFWGSIPPEAHKAWSQRMQVRTRAAVHSLAWLGALA